MVYCIDVNNGDILWVGVSTGDSVAMAIEDNKLYLAIGGMATASEDILNQPSGIYCVNINNFELEWEKSRGIHLL
jgi:outer membrane protein assembly factor BamB